MIFSSKNQQKSGAKQQNSSQKRGDFVQNSSQKRVYGDIDQHFVELVLIWKKYSIF